MTITSNSDEEIPYILDYARHLLSFKLGGDEFASSFPLYDNFQAGAARRNTRWLKPRAILRLYSGNLKRNKMSNLPAVKLIAVFVFLALAPLTFARGRYSGWCERGNQVVVTPGMPNSTTKVQRSFPACR